MLNTVRPSFIGFFLLTIFCGILISYPYHNFQQFVAQGDHGRDLYAAAAVLRGEVPYRDFWWTYGPLMPYYYGYFFKNFGMDITSLLLGKNLLNIGAGIFIYLAMARFFPPVAAFLTAVWFLTYHLDFFFTYNHAAGIMLILACVWLHWGYLKHQRISSLYLSLVPVFFLGFVKINFALTGLLMGLACLFIMPPQSGRRFDTSGKALMALSLLGLPILWYLGYSVVTQGLSVQEIRQCLPYLDGDEPYNKFGPLETIPILIKMIYINIRSSWISLALCGLVIFSCMQTAFHIINKKDKTPLLLIIYSFLFYVLNLHEFLKSGMFYRSFWSQPFSIILTFIVILTATQGFSKLISRLLWATLLIIAANSAWRTTEFINSYKTPAHYLGSSRGHVYIGNDRNWLQTVVMTTKTLNSQLKKDDLFFALPYDILYYYLTDKRTPTRQTIFFDHIKIPQEQEARIIQELEKNRIAAVLVSNRQSSIEYGLGTLGVTYCPLVAQYINTNFSPYARIGDWSNEPGWSWNHGTIILKRNPAHE